MAEVVYLNGDLIPLEEAKISVRDYGFLYGYGLFETVRAYNGHVFRLDEHLDRLAGGAEKLGIAVDIAEIKEAVAATIKANRFKETRVRIAVSVGEGNMSSGPATGGTPTVVVMAAEYHPHPDAVYQKGFRAVWATSRIYRQSPLSGLKTANYLVNLLARQAARAAGADEAILLNDIGLVAEASMSNIFLVRGDRLLTPGTDSGILPGITRRAVLELAAQLGISATERDITPEELLTADEAFLTGSLIEVMPLTEVEGKPIGRGRPGTVTQRLIAAYRRLVREATPSEG
jgi:branched-chain amino acid aminotransferase group I